MSLCLNCAGLESASESNDSKNEQSNRAEIGEELPLAGIKGKSGPPGNQNAFRHGLASISDRRATGALTPEEQSIRQEILSGLIADRGGEQQISTATRILAEVIAADAALLVAFNKATDAVIEKNQKARENPKALATLDGYKRGLVTSLTGNLQRFGFERVAKVETLQEIIDEMGSGTTENSSLGGPGATHDEQDDGSPLYESQTEK